MSKIGRRFLIRSDWLSALRSANPRWRLVRDIAMLVSVISVIGSAAMGLAQQRQAQLSWWDRAEERKIGNYWIKTDVPAAQANALAQHLNFMYDEYAKRLGRLPVRVQEKLNVLIFKDRKEYIFTLRARFGVSAEASGGIFFVRPAGTALAFWIGDLPQQRIQHVVQHEAFHQFAYSRFGNDMPIWLNEGLAELFGEAVLVNKQLLFGQSSPHAIEAVKHAIESSSYLPFEQMLNISTERWNALLKDDSAALAYWQARSMVHFLIYGDDGKYLPMFEKYLAHLSSAMPADHAFTRSFGSDVQLFEQRWKQAAMQAAPSAFVTALERIEFLAEGMLALHQRKVYPQSLDDLKQALRDHGFEHMLKSHAIQMKLSAQDASLFEIPMDSLCAQQPVFALEKARPNQSSRREAILEQTNPTPAQIVTEHLRPANLQVKWIRDVESNTFSYQIVVR